MAIGNSGNLQITDSDLEKLRGRIGREQIAEASFTLMTADILRRFARYCLATDNPLFTDDAYGAASRFGSLIAPPCAGYVTISAGRGGMGLPGIFALHATDEWEFKQPVKPGDQIYAARRLKSVEEKASKWGGRAIHQTIEYDIRNQREETTTLYRNLLVRAERGKATAKKKYEYEPYRYTQKEMDDIYAGYEAEVRRGATPLYWEDVPVGDSIGHVVKGPMTVADIICWWMGAGAPLLFPFGLRYQQFKQRPGLAIIDPETNISHSPESAHYDVEYAKRSGVPAPYDTGRLRSCWFSHLLTNWIGDAGWLKELRCNFLSPNYVGDTTWIRGVVTEKFERDGEHLVRIGLTADTQREHRHSTAEAVVSLPTKTPEEHK